METAWNLPTACHYLSSKDSRYNSKCFFLVSADKPAFLAYAKTSSKVGNVIKFDDVVTNIGKHYSPSTGVFTAPQNGLYNLGCMIMNSGKHHISYYWMKNNVFLSHGLTVDSSHAASQSHNIVLNLKKGDQMYIKLIRGGTIQGTRHSYITGYLL